MKLLLTLTFLIIMAMPAFAGWSNWAKIPNGLVDGEPSVVITKNGAINVMVRGTDNALWHNYTLDGGKSWKGWAKVGGILTSSPSCTQPISDIVECYVRNAQNGVSQINRINGAWGKYADVGGILLSNVASVSPSEDFRGVFGIATTGQVAVREWRAYVGGGWLNWFQMSAKPGINSTLSCGAVSGNSMMHEGHNITNNQWACIVGKPNGGFSLVQGTYKDAKTTYNKGEKALPFAEAASYPMSVFMGSLAEKMDVYFVAKDKQMKRGTYEFASGWKGSFEQIGNGVFTSGASCARGNAKGNVKTACAGRGTDGAVWISYRRPD